MLLLRQTSSNRLTIPVILGSLKRAGILTQFDLSICSNQTQLKKALEAPVPKLLAFSFMTPHLESVLNEVRTLKANSKQAVWIAGGPHATGDPQSLIKMGFDWVASGEGEILFPKMATKFLENPDKIATKILTTSESYPLDNSFPLFHPDCIVPPLEITRGCFYRCRFCQTGSLPPRHRSLDSVLEFYNQMKSAGYLTRTGFICPSGFEYGAEAPGKIELSSLEALLHEARKTGIKHVEYGLFPSELRPETITPDRLKLIKKYCSNKKITLGGQSGSKSLLKKIRRGHGIEQMEEAIRTIREAGLTPQIDIILGLPDETFEDCKATLAWIKKLHQRFAIRTQVHYFIPLAGTPYSESDPKPLGRQIESMLHEYYRAGICTNWWIEGKKMSESVVRMRKALKQI